MGENENYEDRCSRVSQFDNNEQCCAEGEGRVQNLFEGWFERVASIGVGGAWLDNH